MGSEHRLGRNLVDDADEIEAEAQELGYVLTPDPDEVSDIGEATGENWRDFPEIATNSLWIIGSRERTGAHVGDYHGNFVPQIPFQAIRRFTRPGEVVLDVFLGSGTSLIEARRQGRHGIGIELIPATAALARGLVASEENPRGTWQEVIVGDSAEPATTEEVRRVLGGRGRDSVQLIVAHPPYHDIIRFSDHPDDLSNAPTLEAFIERFKSVLRATYGLLEDNRFLVVVIGDKYRNREWIPLGFYTMQAAQQVGYRLKSIVVKNMEGNRAKRNLENLWRQRAFRGKYYIFKHEYVLFLEKPGHS
ncbi:MAG: site-specific DNA-methyltransferase [Chloroflexi bacterium]|nr:site-specific DNA-methyltransferase [Chloroflexota bacterium]